MHLDHPMIPLTTPLMHGMCEGAKVEIEGTPFHGPHHGFTVEFLTHHGSVFHMDVRFQQHAIILNNFHDGRWHCEERFSLHFCVGTHFHLKIKNHPGHFAIHVNGLHIAHFHHRVSCHSITAFHIRGDVAVHKLGFKNFAHPIVIGSAMPAPMVMAQPVYAQPAPVIVAAHPAPVVVVEDHHHHGGAAVAGAVVGGAVLGAALSHHHHRHHGHW